MSTTRRRGRARLGGTHDERLQGRERRGDGVRKAIGEEIDLGIGTQQSERQHDEAKKLLDTIQQSRKKDTHESGVLSQLTDALKSQEQDNQRLKTILTHAEQRLSKLAA